MKQTIEDEYNARRPERKEKKIDAWFENKKFELTEKPKPRLQ